MPADAPRPSGRWLPRVAALCLLGGAGLAVASIQSGRWVVERRGDEVAVLGPGRMTLCEAGACVGERYVDRLRAARAALRSGQGTETDREQWRSTVALMRYDLRKTRQIVIPAWLASVVLAIAGLSLGSGLLPARLRWLRRSSAGLAALASVGLLVAALVFADGMSHFPAVGTEVRWARGFWMSMAAAGLGLLGALLGVLRLGAPRTER